MDQSQKIEGKVFLTNDSLSLPFTHLSLQKSKINTWVQDPFSYVQQLLNYAIESVAQ